MDRIKHLKRKRRVRAKLVGTEERPRISVFRSNKNIYAQIIDDNKGVTLVSASTKTEKLKTKGVESAKKIGQKLAEIATKKGIKKASFDRSGHKYHGRVKAIAEGAREGGLDF